MLGKRVSRAIDRWKIDVKLESSLSAYISSRPRAQVGPIARAPNAYVQSLWPPVALLEDQQPLAGKRYRPPNRTSECSRRRHRRIGHPLELLRGPVALVLARFTGRADRERFVEIRQIPDLRDSFRRCERRRDPKPQIEMPARLASLLTVTHTR